MKIRNALFAIAVGFSSVAVATTASAQVKTRDEVRLELIDAENNGSRLVADASYPDVSRVYQQQVAQRRALHDSGTGPGSGYSGSSEAGQKTATVAPASNSTKDGCVGPAGFCTPYFGS
ncbi:DUF4148 domain-containing protein [Paraburkholderia lycopersici]|uniref:DUF4148 domain-containing protein n=1 Tax=Paraburkholderia lycopersici TaxID=416944 RepID=A0A1G7A0Y6_9BURK|nr:DUF4148 domain-containing protein [Paraburkholderia lycopersici]SDE08440.1 protein of unknown function [Paraburkholderia lycopersici]